MPTAEARVPLTVKSLARLAAANQQIQQAQTNLAATLGLILEAMGVEGKPIDLNLRDGYVLVQVPGIYAVPDEPDFSPYEPEDGPPPTEQDTDPIPGPNSGGCDEYCTHEPVS